MAIHNAEDVLDHARWAARKVGQYALAHELDYAHSTDHEKDIEEIVSDHEREIDALNGSHADEMSKLEDAISDLETENESLRLKCDEQSDRIAELEKEITLMINREARL